MEKGGAKESQEAGFNGFLPKPINRLKLFKMMEQLLGETTEKEKWEEESKFVTQYSMREDAKHATTILLVEDNPVSQKLAVKLLTKAGYRVDVARNGKEAIDIFTAGPEKYDIIFMDVQMPELNGLEATRMLREKGFTQIPIVAMTAEAMKGDREKCLESGMNDYIPKPIKREVVFEMLDKWVFNREV
jgi:CheY-like chemotaxis protein